jgi:hypothetical protein
MSCLASRTVFNASKNAVLVVGYQMLENQTWMIDSTELPFLNISAITIVFAAQYGDPSYPIH